MRRLAGASHPWAVASLVGVNLAPVVGVALLGWSLLDLMLLYWFENIVIGVYTLLKMVTTTGVDDDAPRAPLGAFFHALFVTVFFAFHYGFFWSGHGNFLVMLFDDGGARMGGRLFADGILGLWASGWVIAGAYLRGPLALAAVALFASHGVSYATNFLLRDEGAHLAPKVLMFQPYARVAVLHVTLLVGGFAAAGLGEPVLLLLPFVVLKTVVDLWSHGREHRGPG